MMNGSKTLTGFPAVLTVPLLWLTFGTALFYYGTDSVWLAPSLICVLLMCAAFLASGLKSGWAIPRAPVVIIMIMNWLYLFVMLHWSTSPFVSELFFAIWSMQPLIFMTLLIGDRAGENAWIHGLAMLAAAATVALWAVMQYLFFHAAYGPRIHHPLLDPNNMATLLNMGLMPAVALFMTAGTRRDARLLFVLAGLFYAGLIATQSRGGVLCGGVAMALMMPFLALPVQQKWRRLLALTALLALTPVLMQFYMKEVYSHIFANTGGRGLNFGGNPASVTDRLTLWRSTWHMIKDHLWAGPGLGTFYFYYSRYRQPIDQSDGFFAHIDSLQLWEEVGLPAFVLFYAMLLAMGLRTLRAIHLAKPEQYAERAGAAACFAGFLAAALHSHINFVVYLPALCLPMTFLLAWWYVATERIIRDSRFSFGSEGTRRASRIAFAAVIFLSAWAAQWVVRGSLDTHYIKQAADAEGRDDVAAMRAATEKAAFYAPADSYRADQYAARWRVLMLREGQNLTDEEKRTLLDDGLRHVNRALALNSGFAYIRTIRADLYVAAQENGLMPDGYDRALDDLKIALEADPLCLDARYAMASIYQRRGELKEAINVLGEGLNWPCPKGPPEVRILVSVALLCQATGDQERYQRLMEQADATAQRYGLIK
jgi:O-antigen ligase